MPAASAQLLANTHHQNAHHLCAAGVTYVKQIQLPSLAMQIYNVNLLVEDSIFDSLASHALAAIAFSNSTVTFRNCTFTSNENSAGALCFGAFICEPRKLACRLSALLWTPIAGWSRVLSDPQCIQALHGPMHGAEQACLKPWVIPVLQHLVESGPDLAEASAGSARHQAARQT